MMNQTEKLTWLMTTADEALTALRKGINVEEKAPSWPHIFMTGSVEGKSITLIVTVGIDEALAGKLEEWAKKKRCKSVMNTQCTVMMTF